MATTVLYVHGLESGPHGRKARYIAEAGFTVVSHLMPCGRAQITRDPIVIVAALSAIAVVVGATLRGGVLGLVIATAVAAVLTPLALPMLMRRVVSRSVRVQTRALASSHIDVVVGSSFGGAIALELLARGAWSGPTVLLCPAHQLVAQRARARAYPRLADLPETVAAHVVVIHGRRDEVVPLPHSEELVAGSRARLLVVDDTHRLSATATPAQLASWIELARA